LILLSCLLFNSFGSKKPDIISSVDNKIMDIMFKFRGPQQPSGKVVIVDIDEKSLKHIGQWPWPRNILADLTLAIQKNGALVTGFDIVFPEVDRTSPARCLDLLKDAVQDSIPDTIFSSIKANAMPDYDLAFGDAVAQGKTVLGYAFQIKDDGFKSEFEIPFPSGEIRVDPSNTNFKDLSLRPAYRAILNISSVSTAESEGFFNIFPDASGIARQVPLLMMMDGIPYPSLSFEIFRVGKGISSFTIHTSQKISDLYSIIMGISVEDTFIPTNHNGEIFINYRGPYNTFTYVSAVDVINKDVRHLLQDKFVLIGSSATGLSDVKATPFSEAMPGIEINATIVDNLLQADPFVYDIYTEIGLTYTLLVLCGVLLTSILAFFGPIAGAAGAILFFALSFAGNYYFFFLNNQHLGITYPLFTCGAILFIVSVFNYLTEGRAKRYIQKAFSYYVAPDVVSELIKNPETLSLKGEQKELTVLFSDIRGFTGISEKMDSQALGNFMNEYLTRMSHVIMENGGTVDKFIGDAIMAFWGAPKDEPDHACKAVQAALLMEKQLEIINQAFKEKNMPRVSIRVGINSGPMSVGNFGSKDRFDYTVMGDNVNLASRLEAVNKIYGTTIIISEFTKQRIKDAFYCRYIDKVRVKGKENAIDIFEPFMEGTPPPDIIEETQKFERGVKEYQAENYEAADRIMGQLHENNPKKLYNTYLSLIRESDRSKA